MRYNTHNAQRTTHDELYAVILAGGPGERFWPASRVNYPKYAMEIIGPKSVIEQTVARLKGFISEKNILIVTTKDQMDIIRKKLKKLIAPRNFLIEPCSKDTAAAIGLAAIHIRKKNPNATMVVLPADQHIRDAKGFQLTIKNAITVAERGYLVTLGMKPTFPSTGYGYIKTRNQKPETSNQKLYYEVEKFVEKPDRKTAKAFLKSSRFFWNSGIFVWKVDSILESIRNYMPRLYNILLKTDKISKAYKGLKKISVDYGIMERAKDKVMVPARFNWVDLGSWVSLEKIYKRDRDKNVCKGLIVNYDTKNSVIIGSKNHLIATIGVKNLVIVHTDDATLVADKTRPQEIKGLVRLIRKRGLKRYL